MTPLPQAGSSGSESIHVSITANTYFGARHGMETLSQMISYDELADTLQVPVLHPSSSM